MKIGYAILLLLSAVAALVLICLGVIRHEQNCPDTKFDERQQASRGKAYRFSWNLSWCYNLIVMFVLILTEREQIVNTYLLIILIVAGIMLQVMGFDCYCALTDSAVGPSQRPGAYIGGGIFMGVMYLADTSLSVRQGYLPVTGKEAFGWVWILAGTAFLFRGMIQLLRQSRKGKE